MSRSRLYTIPTLAMVAAIAMACSDQSTAPTSRATIDEGSDRRVTKQSAPPASVGWQEQARSLVAANNLSVLAAARIYAALSVAQYRAVMAIQNPDAQGDPSAHGIGAGGRSELEAQRGAVAGASVQVLSFFFPAAAPNLEHNVLVEGEKGPGNGHPQFTRGLDIGRHMGDALVDRARSDHFTAPWTGTVPVGTGKWVANGPPGGATLGGVTPYFLTSADQFRPPPPPEFGSAAFLADLNEIATLAANRTPAQAASAVYWNFPTGTFTPAGYWNLVASNYVEAYSLDERAAARAFALTHTAMMDALVGCWEAKYYYWMLRPSQSNSAITLTFGLPNFPAYPSGHSCVSAAAATVLGSLFPDRTTELGTFVTEAGLSRMYAGIHYRFDITAGRELGNSVGRWVIEHPHLLD